METEAEQKEPSRSAKPWLDMLSEAERVYKDFQDRATNIEKLYADLKALASGSQDREFQIFWANLEILKPTIYSRPPAPVVTPRFRDRRPLPRAASDLLERALQTDVEVDDLHATLMSARDDLATSSRGAVWVRDFTQPAEDGSQVSTASPTAEHVDREDFRHGPARKWKEVPWTARRAWLTRDEFKARFSEDQMDGVTFTEHSEGTGDAEDKKGAKKAEVWELWSKPDGDHPKGIVVWVTPSQIDRDVLDMQEPWINLDGFFPCPRPAYGTLQPRTLIPVPDFLYYKDQVEEINELTARISALSEALRLVGFYPAGSGDVASAIQFAFASTSDNARLIPVTSHAALGGVSLKDSIVWLPVVEVAQVIAQLVELRKLLIDDVYQITGLSDIMRGTVDPKEKLGQSELKSQYGNIRVSDRQGEMARLARDVIRIKAEILAETADPQVLLDLSQVDDLPRQAEVQQQMMQAQMAAQQGDQQAQQQMAELQRAPTLEAVMELLRNQRLRPFVLEVETDSTIQPDEEREKQRRIEATTAIGTFMKEAFPMVAQEPALADFVGETLQFVAGGFRMGRQMDTAIDELVEQMKQPRPQQADPEAQKAQAEQQKMQAEMQMRGQEMQGEMQMKEREFQMRAQEMQTKAQLDAQKMQMELQAKAQELEFAREKHALEMQMMQDKLAMQRETASMDLQVKEASAEMDAEHRQEMAAVDVAKAKAMAKAKPKEARSADD